MSRLPYTFEERLLRRFAPVWAARRAHARLLADPDNQLLFGAMLRARGYRNAQNKNANGPFGDAQRTADAEIVNDLPKLRARSRELNRDDSIASGLTDLAVTNVIGGGMRPRAATGSPDLDRLLETLWTRRERDLFPAEDLPRGAAQRQRFAKKIEDGEYFIKAVVSPAEPVWFELVEADRVDTPLGYTPPAGHTLVAGVERDADGRIVAYHIRRASSGDVVLLGQKKSWAYDRVEKAYVRHCRLGRKVRPGQTRGVPWFHAVLQDLRDIDLLLVAGLKRSQIAACLAAFIETDLPTVDIPGLEETTSDADVNLSSIEPGMILKLKPGEKVNSFMPNFPVPELVPFIMLLACRIGAALGLSWEAVLRKYDEDNYSSARVAMLNDRDGFRVEQQDFLEDDLNWLWGWVMRDAALRGQVSAQPGQLDKVRWIARGWRWVDPQKEGAAAKIERELCIASFSDQCMDRGLDPDEQFAEIVREKSMFAAADIPWPYAGEPEPPAAPEPEPAPAAKRNGFARLFQTNGRH